MSNDCSKEDGEDDLKKQDRKCMYRVKLSRFPANNFAVGKQ